MRNVKSTSSIRWTHAARASAEGQAGATGGTRHAAMRRADSVVTKLLDYKRASGL